jgi:hypothetical protein
MKSAWSAAAGAAAISLAATVAHAATTITFDDVDPNPTGVFMQSYVSQGMRFTNLFATSDGPIGLFFPPDVNPFGFTNIDPGGASVLGDPLEMRVDGGGTFDYGGFTFATDRSDRPLISGFIAVKFTFADYSTETDIFNTAIFGPVAVATSKTNVRVVDFQRGQIVYGSPCGDGCVQATENTSFVIDNVIVDNVVQAPDPPPPGVPEPGEWALMLVGFGLAGATLRHRRTIAAQ